MKGLFLIAILLFVSLFGCTEILGPSENFYIIDANLDDVNTWIGDLTGDTNWETSWDVFDANMRDYYVPYVGATKDVNLGYRDLLAYEIRDLMGRRDIGLTTRLLYDSDENMALSWGVRILADEDEVSAIQWNNRFLINDDGDIVAKWVTEFELMADMDGSGESIYDLLNLTADGNIYSDYAFTDHIYHAYGGFQDQTETLSIEPDTWTFVTNADNNLWTGLEADGMMLVDDNMVISNAGDYVGNLSVTFEGGQGKDYLFRIYNMTQDEQAGYHIGSSGAGNNNYVNTVVPIYLEADAGDVYQFQVYTVDGEDIMFLNAIFALNYLHD